MALTEEGENFVRLSQIILEVIPKHLRSLFESKWNTKYPVNQWSDTAACGSFLLKEINKVNKSGMKCTFSVKQALTAGDKNQWDCTTLFYILLFSNLELIPKTRMINKRSLPLLISEDVDKLREIRNGSFGHLPSASISKADYQQCISDIEKIFANLGWMQGLQEINSIKNNGVSTSQMATLKTKLKDESRKNDEFLELRKEFEMLKNVGKYIWQNVYLLLCL